MFLRGQSSNNNQTLGNEFFRDALSANQSTRYVYDSKKKEKFDS